MANRQLEDQVMNLQATLARSRQADRYRRYSMALLGLSILCFLPTLTNEPGSLSEWRSALGSAAIIAALPTLLVYVVAGKYFIRGLTAGSVKG